MLVAWWFAMWRRKEAVVFYCNCKGGVLDEWRGRMSTEVFLLNRQENQPDPKVEDTDPPVLL